MARRAGRRRRERRHRRLPRLAHRRHARLARDLDRRASPCHRRAPLSYDLVQANGQVAALGGPPYYGSAYGIHLVAPIVALVPTPDRKGYWLVGADGSVFPYGDAKYEGDAGGKVRPAPVEAARPPRPTAAATGSSPRPAGCSPSATPSATARSPRPVKGHAVAIVATADGKGYWIACSTGRSSPSATPTFHGERGGPAVGQPIVAMAATPDGGGYWLGGRQRNRVLLRRRPATGSERPRLAAQSPVVGLTVTPRDRRLARRAERHRAQLRHCDRPRFAHRRDDPGRRHRRDRCSRPRAPSATTSSSPTAW